MFKGKRQHPYNFGRVFFPEKQNSNPIPIPNKVYFQPLGNHVGNVRRLVKAWDINDFPGATLEERQASCKRVLKAADIHDMGKPQKFKIDVKTSNKGNFKEYIYSFRGHRFLASSPNELWAQSLAIGHHDFSVKDISRDAYKLKKESQDNTDILVKDPLAYARELYILEMCDQIEAELACRIIGDDEQAESRAFMDYTTAKSELDDQSYLIDPYPFKDKSVFLPFEYWVLELNQADKDSLQSCIDANQEHKLGIQLDKIVKDWWQLNQGQPKKEEPKQAILKPYESVNNLKSWDCQTLYQALGNFTPNPMQVKMFDALANNNDPAILLKSPTGSGKTESILFPALAKGDRLFLPLPARSLLEDQKERIEKYLKQFSKLQPGREISLVVDTGSQMYRWVYRNGEEFKRGINPRRHLYKGDVILTTLDKFLYRYFAFGDKQKSFIFPLRINQKNTLICFDEAHSYDDISFTNFHSLVKSLYEAGRSLVLMTATMPLDHIHESFDYLDTIDYIDDSDKADQLRQFYQQALKQPYLNQRSFEWVRHIKRDPENPENFQNEFAQILLKEWKLNSKRRIIAVIETVKDAVEIYKQIKSQLNVKANSSERFLFLYHGRIAEQIRPTLYREIKKLDERKNEPYILITTSAIEVGCDLNCDTIISQICPPENLIQRVGRCNRKGNVPNAKVIVIGNQIPEFANSLDEAGWANYQNTLLNLKQFETKTISECISRSQQVDDYRVVELFSMLHEYVYQADLTCQPLHERGLIPTRSWKPSVNLEFHNQQVHSISVPIDRLCSGERYAKTYAYEKRYDKENSQWNTGHLLGWGSAYGKEITVKICPEHDGVVFDASLQEYLYDEELGFVELPKIFIKKWTDGAEEKLLYVEGGHKAIITYTTSLNK